MSESHSFGPTCVYYEDNENNLKSNGHDPPPVKAQFFYLSSLPIDDPLSPLPPIQIDKTAKQSPQPFSTRDNAALEEAWQGFQKDDSLVRGRQSGSQPKSVRNGSASLNFGNGQAAGSPSTGRGVFSRYKAKEFQESNVLDGVVDDDSRWLKAPKENGVSIRRSERTSKTSVQKFTNKNAESDVDSDRTMQTESQVMLSQISPDHATDIESPMKAKELEQPNQDYSRSVEVEGKHSRRFSPFRKKHKDRAGVKDDFTASSFGSQTTPGSLPDESTLQTASDMSGKPFARAPSRRDIPTLTTDGTHGKPPISSESENSRSRSRDRFRNLLRRHKRKENAEDTKLFVPVGVSRLHLVQIPDLIMKPIYWSPINDTASVIRATWFYKETMLPVPHEVANLLEIGYEYMKPYADSYQDELQACIDHGATAELKIVHKLWPDIKPSTRPNTATDGKIDEQEQVDVRFSLLPDHNENVAFDPRQLDRKKERPPFENYSVIYADERNAQILRPNLLPSLNHNRRPLSSIRRGREIGIAVVRGFDRKTWLRLHPNPKMDTKLAHAKVGAYMSQSGDATTRGRRMSCAVCDKDSQIPKVSDLVLVIHGIGQKLSERVDSFHFTHAVNGLRREFNVELSSESVKGNIVDTSGIMVLPVNWRLTLSFDEEQKLSKPDSDNTKYHLKDITPDSLQAVRSLISDVMLDIPYYLSHHKDKMISAVIREANRVYRLWCRNNPGFEQYGRVHLIAHSLGSVMAMEILSQQPTKLPTEMKLESSRPSETMFEFDTTNLFCCGSPVGFFLLLNNANLVPRKGREKPEMEGEDYSSGIAGEASYGCLALDNLYNICHRNDPVSFLLNAAVDKDYAASLQPAVVPVVSTGLFARVGNTLRWTPNSGLDPYSSAPTRSRPQIQSMPSTVEMDTHNFTREEIAEKRMYLLNENGQIDYYLNSGGGPLEIQYLNMLSAHSSYWILQDFVRFLVVEIGRKAGKQNTLPALRAVKKREFRRGNIS